MVVKLSSGARAWRNYVLRIMDVHKAEIEQEWNSPRHPKMNLARGESKTLEKIIERDLAHYDAWIVFDRSGSSLHEITFWAEERFAEFLLIWS